MRCLVVTAAASVRWLPGSGSRSARQKAMGGSVERKVVHDVQLPEAITVGELANRMSEKVADVVKALMTNGIMATQTQTIDDTAELIIEEFGHKVVRVSDADVEDAITQVEDDEDLKERAPIITIMGHVDHGKLLLDAIRNTCDGWRSRRYHNIGAYQVTTEGGQAARPSSIHLAMAFTSMRSRGAQVTDIVFSLLVADDAVMRKLSKRLHTQSDEVLTIVAINKIDREAANLAKLDGFAGVEVIVEKMSGDVQDVEVSAITGQGLPDLLEAIALQAEILELKAQFRPCRFCAVIEAQLDVGRGPVATVLVQNGTLEQGDIFVVGEQGKVRALLTTKVAA